MLRDRSWRENVFVWGWLPFSGATGRYHAAFPLYPGGILGVSLDIENYCTIRASPACQRRFYSFCLLVSKIKGRDCGTINGHDESLSIRALMKDAREVLVR